jgi:hypothetical protein
VAPSSSAGPDSRRPVGPRVRRLLAVLVALHGVAHLAGTADSFSKAADGGAVDYLAGAWTVADPTLLRVFGVIWAVLAAAFMATAVMIWLGRRAWPRALAAVSTGSLILVGIALWASVIGLVVNAALLAVAVRALRWPPASSQA